MKKFITSGPCKLRDLFSADPDQKPHHAVSDQGLHCLLTECSIITWE